MADELEPVTQRFTAEVEDYVAEVQEAAEEAKRFADASLEAKAGADELRDGAAEAAPEIGHMRDEALEATAAMHELRDAEVEAGAAGAEAGGGGMSMMVVGIIALIGAIAAVAPAVLAAGLGIGAFAAFAIPAIMQVTGALGDNAKQLAKLPAPVQEAVRGIKSLEGEYKSIGRSLEPQAFSIFNQALRIAAELLPKLVPLAQAGGQALGDLVGSLGKGLDSKGFSDFLSMLTKLVVPAALALGQLAGTLTGILGSALTQLAPMSIPFINMLTGLLKAASPALTNGLKLIAQTIMDIGRAITPALGPLGKFFGYLSDHPVFAQIIAGIIGIAVAVKIFQGVMSAVSMLSNPWLLLAVAVAAVAILIATHTHQISEAFDIVRHAVAEAGHEIAHTFDDIRHDIARLAGDARHGVATVGDDIIRPFEQAYDWVKSHWKEILAWLVDPVGMAVLEIRTHTHEIAQAFDDARHDVAAILAGSRHDIAQALDLVRHDVASFAAWVPHEIATLWDDARHEAASVLAGLRHDAASAWDDMRHDIASFADWAPREWLGLWGKILSFVASLPGRMLTAGRNIVEGLIHGIESGAAAIPGVMKSLAGDVVSYFTNPLKIFSPSKEFQNLGEQITAGLTLGIAGSRQQAVNESRFLAEQVAAAFMAGDITSSQEASLRKKLATALTTALKGGVQDAFGSGTLKTIGESAQKLLQTIWDTEKGGFIGKAQASQFAGWVKADNATLQSLAVQRNAIAKEIAAAQALARNTASASESTFNLSSASTTAAGGQATTGGIISNLNADVGKIRRFAWAIRKLAKEGLNKSYLSQLISLGPEQGGPIAAELAGAGLGDIKSINAAESAITYESNQLGANAVSAMYTAGKQSGAGFLQGLKDQKKAIETLMSQIAAGVIGQLRKDLGIASPSRVMFEHGVSTLQGYINGVKSMQPQLQALMKGIGGGVALGGVGGVAAGGGSGYGGAGQVHVTVPLTAIFGAGSGSLATDPRFMQFIQAAVQEAVARWSLNNPGTGFGLPGRA